MASPVPPVLPGPLPEVEEVSDFLSARGDIPNDKKRMFIFRHTVTLKNFKSALERWDSITDNEKRLWIAYRGRFMARFPPQPIAAQPKATHKSLAIGDAPPPLDVNAPLSPTAEPAHPTDPMQCLSQPPIKDEAVDTNQLASFCSPVPSIRSETPVSPTPTLVGDDQQYFPDLFIDPILLNYLEASCGISRLPQSDLDDFYSTP